METTITAEQVKSEVWTQLDRLILNKVIEYDIKLSCFEESPVKGNRYLFTFFGERTQIAFDADSVTDAEIMSVIWITDKDNRDWYLDDEK